jgi:ribosomal protein S18 acetylase RimI-like enzyme
METIIGTANGAMGMQDMQIRRAEPGDVVLLVELGRRTFYETFREFNTEEDMNLFMEENLTTAVLKEEMKEEGAVFFLVYWEGKAVGFTKVRVGHEPPELAGTRVLEVERLYVDKDYQGKKIGLRLMENNMQYGLRNGYSVIWLGVWEHNTKAIRFYENRNFTAFGSHSFRLGNDLQTDILMKRMM